GARFRLLFRNGGPYPPPYPRFDHVQQVTEVYLELALNAGSPPGQQSLVPAAFTIPATFTPLLEEEKAALRRKLGLPHEKPIVLSVSAVNITHKRLDYLIRELAGLSEPRPYLLILGQPDAETSRVVTLADELLGAGNYRIDTVEPEEMADHYRSADVLVLASTREGFGRVMVEAMSHGLPCLAHDYAISRYVLGDQGDFADFTSRGALTALVQQVLGKGVSPQQQREMHRTAFERFSWDGLRPAYVDLIHRCAGPRSL
ncbi:glycosyltransferase, partial [Limnoraphis robusta CCNP1324]|uniref:glycosyltransferase family 4 protein n=1 Tax=Limnoraphis robusta TaxID=1118279 RepID=UPI002B1F2B7C